MCSDAPRGRRQPREAMERNRLEEISHTADIGFRARASSLPDLFRLAAEGLRRAVSVAPAGGAGEPQEVRLERPDLERLMVAWLRELLGRGAADRLVPEAEEVDVRREGDGFALRASVRWRPWAEGSEPVREIKGVTYHGLEVSERDGEWHAAVVLDV